MSENTTVDKIACHMNIIRDIEPKMDKAWNCLLSYCFLPNLCMSFSSLAALTLIS